MTRIIDGNHVAAEILNKASADTQKFEEETGRGIGLAVVLIGDDPASAVYVRMKKKDCAQVGITSYSHHLPESAAREEVLTLIGELNRDDNVHGILVQLPLPSHLDEEEVISAISPEKDVDGFTPINMGLTLRGQEGLRACTPLGVMRLLEHYGVDCQGKHAVVVGRSTIVGKPQALLLLEKNATVTVCHSRTVDLPALCRQADILVAAVGVAELIGEDCIKPGAVVIDVGINRGEEGLVGDVDFEAAKACASAITPVPGGVGPMTRAMLIENTITAAQRSQ
jgi:methylenetetrahydrofolate dehydrogenase (NADP+)/methenyltetrahydrofolate cyclohydrolase